MTPSPEQRPEGVAAAPLNKVFVAPLKDLFENKAVVVSLANGKKAAVLRSGGKVYAFEDRCSHDDGELASGSVVDGAQIECPRHGARFDMATGKALCLPAVYPIATYAVEIHNGEVWVDAGET